MRELYFISVFLHILAAAVWIGGMIFLAAVLLPSIKKHPEKAILIHSVGLKFRTVGWIVLTLLLVTGLLNTHLRQIEFSWEGLSGSRFGQLISFKLVIFAVTAIISIAHDFYIGTKATHIWDLGFRISDLEPLTISH